MTLWEIAQALAFWVVLGLVTRGAVSRRQTPAGGPRKRPPVLGLLPRPRDAQEAPERAV
jgi:hypothetical protein